MDSPDTSEHIEKHYKELFNNTSDAMFVCYLNYGKTLGNFVEVNDTACQMLGFTHDEMLKLSPLQVIFENTEEDSLIIIDKLTAGGNLIFNAVQTTKDNHKISSEINSRLFDYNDRPAILFISRDISERKKYEEKIRQRTEQLRNLASKLQLIREEERKTIAREIHDELGQILTVIKIQISLLESKISDEPERAKEKVKSVIKLIDQSIESVQKICSKLRPGLLDEFGIMAAIEWQAQDFQNKTNIICECDLPKEDIQLNQAKSTALFRILQEALVNSARHANANRITIKLVQEKGRLTLDIMDNGKGITQSQVNDPRSLGLLGMKERALVFGGTVEIRNSMHSGTLVRTIIPLNEQELI